jgi:hypothetical protein
MYALISRTHFHSFLGGHFASVSSISFIPSRRFLQHFLSFLSFIHAFLRWLNKLHICGLCSELASSHTCDCSHINKSVTNGVSLNFFHH